MSEAENEMKSDEAPEQNQGCGRNNLPSLQLGGDGLV